MRHTLHLIGGQHDGGRLVIDLSGDPPDEIIFRQLQPAREVVYAYDGWRSMARLRLEYLAATESGLAVRCRELEQWLNEKQHELEVAVAEHVCDRIAIQQLRAKLSEAKAKYKYRR